MDIPELEKLAEVLIKSDPRDLQKARAGFLRLTVSDPQALFVMADDVTRAAIAADWFDNRARQTRSAHAEGPASIALPGTAKEPVPAPTNSPPATDKVSSEDHRGRAGGETPPGTTGQDAIAHEGHYKSARGAPDTRDPGGSAAIVAYALAAQAVFNTFKVRGAPIGDIMFCQIDRLIAKNGEEACVLRQIRRHIQAPGETLIRDAVKAADLQRFIQNAREHLDVA